MSIGWRAAAASLPLLLCGCSYQTYQSMVGDAGVENRQFQTLFWIFLGICTFMYVLVIAFFIAGSSAAEAAKRMSSRPAAITNRIR